MHERSLSGKCMTSGLPLNGGRLLRRVAKGSSTRMYQLLSRAWPSVQHLSQRLSSPSMPRVGLLSSRSIPKVTSSSDQRIWTINR